MKKVAFVFRRAFHTPELEEAAAKICATTNGDMDRVFFVSGGSEATETAIKLARKYHIDNGHPSKFRVISRWQSYHALFERLRPPAGDPLLSLLVRKSAG
jgi:adenosylmethionine-8-amino-7-oxononanoate aminotransferase